MDTPISGIAENSEDFVLWECYFLELLSRRPSERFGHLRTKIRERFFGWDVKNLVSRSTRPASIPAVCG